MTLGRFEWLERSLYSGCKYMGTVRLRAVLAWHLHTGDGVGNLQGIGGGVGTREGRNLTHPGARTGWSHRSFFAVESAVVQKLLGKALLGPLH